MRWIGAISLVLLGGAIYLALQDPRVSELFLSSPPPQEDPLAFLNEPLERRNKQTESPAPKRPSAAKPAPREALPPEVPNSTVVQVLTGVLRAKQLFEGVHLAVSDQTVTVSGEVDSAEKKKAILEIIEKGRGRRKIDSSQLVVTAER